MYKKLIYTLISVSVLAGCSDSKAPEKEPAPAASTPSSPAGAPKPMPGARPFKRELPMVDVPQLEKQSEDQKSSQ